jgi:hypothetical protein
LVNTSPARDAQNSSLALRAAGAILFPPGKRGETRSRNASPARPSTKTAEVCGLQGVGCCGCSELRINGSTRSERHRTAYGIYLTTSEK